MFKTVVLLNIIIIFLEKSLMTHFDSKVVTNIYFHLKKTTKNSNNKNNLLNPNFWTTVYTTRNNWELTEDIH